MCIALSKQGNAVCAVLQCGLFPLKNIIIKIKTY